MVARLGPLEISANVLTLTATWTSLMTFIAFGQFPNFLVSYYTLDMLGDQVKSTFVDTEDAFDFIIGKQVANAIGFRVKANFNIF